MFRIVTCLVILAACASYNPCFGQFDQKYTVVNYTDENGLPQNSVSSLTVDKEGFLWLTTENGLVRFDGQHFYIFDKSNTTLSTSRFYSFWPDIIGGSKRIFANNDSFEFLSMDGYRAAADSSEFVEAFSRLAQRRKGLVIHKYRVVVAAGAPGGNFQDYETTSPFTYIMLVPFKKGTYYVVDKTGIGFVSNWKKMGEIAYQRPPLRDLFTMGGELYHFGKDGDIRQVTLKGTKLVKLSGDILADPAYSPQKRNFTGYWNNVSDQCFILLNQRFYFLEHAPDGTLHTRLVLEGFDFDANNIISFHFDRVHSRLFLGSVTRGLFVVSRKPFMTLLASEKDKDNIFYAQTLYDQHRILTTSGNVLGLSDHTPDPTNCRVVKTIVPAVRDQQINRQGDITTDNRGNIWSLSYELLHKFSAGGQRLLKTWDLGEKSMLYHRPYEKLWIGHDKNGISYMDLLSKDPHPIPLISKGLHPVSCFLQTGPGEVWVGTKKGLYSVAIQTRDLKPVAGTESLFIRSIYKSPAADGIFFTTYEDGFFYYKNGRIVNFPLDARKNLTASHCIVESKDGYFWVPTNKGLFQFAKKDLLDYAEAVWKKGTEKPNLFYLYYDKSSGFRTNEFNGGCAPCAVTLPDGKISLPSLNGLVWFNPAAIVPDVAGKKVFIDRLDLAGKTSMVCNDTVKLPLDPRQLAFHPVTPYFGSGNNLRLSYFMSSGNTPPKENEWLPVNTADPVIRFQELSSGDYTLLVRKMNGFGLHNHEMARLVVIVPKHWYETWVFRLFCVALLGGLVYLMVWLRTQSLNRRNEELEVRIRSRTQNLEDTMVALKNSEANLSRQMNIQTRLVASISHDIRTPMKFLVEGAAKIENLIDKTAYLEAIMTARHLGSSAQLMNDLLDNIITYIKTHYYQSQVGLELISLRNLLDEKIRLFYPAIVEQSNHVSNDVDDSVSVFSNAHLLGIILHNLLDNANKYTYKGQIRFYTERHRDQLHLIVADTGPGYPETILHWLENRSVAAAEPGKPSALSPHNNGLGLIIVKELAEILQIDLRVSNENGAKVTLIFTTE